MNNVEYKTDKRTKNLTLRDIHVGDWVQVWSEETERYSPPLKITQICDDGTVYLIIDEENRLDPWEENIKDIDALPIDENILRCFGFDVSDRALDRGVEYQDICYQGKYIGQLRYWEDGCEPTMRLCGFQCIYIHELISYLIRNKYEINFEWKGV